MNPKLLLTLIFPALIFSAKAQKTIAYAITGTTKGSASWTAVRQIDLSTGAELKTVYQKTQSPEILNARTGKAVAKKDAASISRVVPNSVISFNGQYFHRDLQVQSDKPFATNSAALAYDKKHDRLYYTPMGINQLRYIDMSSKTTRIYYFEDDQFGALTGPGNVSNQVTRMVIGGDGQGYALTNNANHLITFTTNKKATITDLGALTDDAANANNSVHSQQNYGGDMVASKDGHLYLIGANQSVYKIDPKTMVALYMGRIQGMPRNYSTNAAAVEEGTKIIVASSNSTDAYYRFDLSTMSAEKLSATGPVFNISDLANSNLVTEKKNKKDEQAEEKQPVVTVPVVDQAGKLNAAEIVAQGRITVFPNPVTSGTAKISLQDIPAGNYQVQMMDLSGKTVSSQSLLINNKTQTEDLKIPSLLSKGNYLVKIVDETNKVVNTAKIIIQ